MNSTHDPRATRPVTLWLIACCVMIFLMAIIGAITRLTESGLSITQWEPIKGALPPLNDTEWNKAYELYKATPQYAGIHSGMSVEEFKGIYFWEWIHRLWGRMIGAVFALPFLFFWVKGMIPKGFKLPLLGILALGGAQGFIGWFMVQSGLEPGQVAVSPYRLALHLGMALLIYGCTLWQILRLHSARFTLPHAPRSLYLHAVIALVCMSVTIIWGAFTAGLDAGKIYNSFPLMDGRFIPSDFHAPAYATWPWIKNITANPAAVQFTHRILATLTFVAIASLAYRLRGISNKDAMALAGAIALQYVLGVLTVLSGAEIALATLHQANAILALTVLIAVMFKLRQRASS